MPSAISVRVAGKSDLPTIQDAIQRHERYGHTFHFIDDGDTHFPGDNMLYFDGDEPPASPVILQLKGNLPADATSIWSGKAFVSGVEDDVQAYRAKAA